MSTEEEDPMPQRCYVPSLERLCLENVARNLESIWDKDSMDNCLAAKFVPSLISIRKVTKSLTSEVLDVLLVSHLTTLDLRFCPWLEINEALLHTIGKRCKKLTVLKLARCNKVPAESLVELVKGLPCLIELDLSFTQCDTQVLFTLASCCRRLRKLSISGCKRLADDSLLYLAYDPLSHSFCCPELQSLIVYGLNTHVHNKYQIKALAFVMLALPSLTSLWHDLRIEALCLIYSQKFDDTLLLPGFPSLKEVASSRMATGTNNESPRPIVALQQISLNDSDMREVIAVCPNLSSIQMFLLNDPLWTQHVLSCHNITRLILRCRTKKDLEELLPVTAIIGPQLLELSLFDFSFKDPVSLHTLLRHCVNLQNFTARFVSHLEGVHSNQTDDKDAMALVNSLSYLELPKLSFFTVDYDSENPLPLRHALVIEMCVASVVRLSPLLKLCLSPWKVYSMRRRSDLTLHCFTSPNSQ